MEPFVLRNHFSPYSGYVASRPNVASKRAQLLIFHQSLQRMPSLGESTNHQDQDSVSEQKAEERGVTYMEKLSLTFPDRS